MAKACVCSEVLTTTASNSLGVVVELAEVHFLPRLRILGRRLVERDAVHVAEGDDVLARDALEVGSAASAAADDGDAQLVVTGLSAEDGRR